MEETNLIQIVVQETSAPFKRSLAQYGTDPYQPSDQKEIIYEDLSEAEKAIYDAFVDMIKSK